MSQLVEQQLLEVLRCLRYLREQVLHIAGRANKLGRPYERGHRVTIRFDLQHAVHTQCIFTRWCTLSRHRANFPARHEMVCMTRCNTVCIHAKHINILLYAFLYRTITDARNATFCSPKYFSGHLFEPGTARWVPRTINVTEKGIPVDVFVTDPVFFPDTFWKLSGPDTELSTRGHFVVVGRTLACACDNLSCANGPVQGLSPKDTLSLGILTWEEIGFLPIKFLEETELYARLLHFSKERFSSFAGLATIGQVASSHIDASRMEIEFPVSRKNNHLSSLIFAGL